MNSEYCRFVLTTVPPTFCVTCVWAGVDKVWEQEKLEARKILEDAADANTSGARFISRFLRFSINALLNQFGDLLNSLNHI